MDLLRDYYCEIKYHPGSSNPVFDALSRKVYVSSLRTSSVSRVVEECCSLGFTFRHKKEHQGVRVSLVLSKSTLYTQIREAQVADPKTQKLARLAQDENTSGLHFQADDMLCLSGHVVVPDDATLIEEILLQAHRRSCSSTWDSSEHCEPQRSEVTSRFWGSFQRALGTTLSLSTTYHPESDRKSKRTIRTLEDMLRAAMMDFEPAWNDHLALVEFAYNNNYHLIIGMAPFKDKLLPRYIGPFEILEKVRDVAYPLALLLYIFGIHDVFHVSLLRQYVANELHILHPTEVKLEQDFSYVERPLRILDRKEMVLRNKRIPLVMVQWQCNAPNLS
ncbi:uncharacterized protein [Henckelia pumila]|uniref:uncharacterized protein n=1 Tax=Henckelia pumila TaxID=405737 RepID=UPI003C6E431C